MFKAFWIIICFFAPVLVAQNSNIIINEFLASNVSTNISPEYHKYSDWLELANLTAYDINLGGYYISDNLSIPLKWRIPDNVIIRAGGYILFWADDENTGVHTNFKLSADGEFIGLFRSDSSIVDSITFGSQQDDVSYGLNGNGEWVFFEKPSPMSSNNSEYFDITPNPVFSKPGGFYNGRQLIELSHSSISAQIRYTINGSFPSDTSQLYVNPIIIDSTTAVRAVAMAVGKLPSEVITHTYLIGEPVSLPVV